MKKLITQLLLCVGLAGCAVNANSGSGSESGAKDMCRQTVEDSLRSPGSAKFLNMSTTTLGETEWDISGDVDSQNGFGALVRSSFTCHITLDNSGTYHPELTAFHDGGRG